VIDLLNVVVPLLDLALQKLDRPLALLGQSLVFAKNLRLLVLVCGGLILAGERRLAIGARSFEPGMLLAGVGVREAPALNDILHLRLLNRVRLCRPLLAASSQLGSALVGFSGRAPPRVVVAHLR
jgi:hypothetical protein